MRPGHPAATRASGSGSRRSADGSASGSGSRRSGDGSASGSGSRRSADRSGAASRRSADAFEPRSRSASPPASAGARRAPVARGRRPSSWPGATRWSSRSAPACRRRGPVRRRPGRPRRADRGGHQAGRTAATCRKYSTPSAAELDRLTRRRALAPGPGAPRPGLRFRAPRRPAGPGGGRGPVAAHRRPGRGDRSAQPGRHRSFGCGLRRARRGGARPPRRGRDRWRVEGLGGRTGPPYGGPGRQPGPRPAVLPRRRGLRGWPGRGRREVPIPL